MKAKGRHLPGDADNDVFALIETLHQTGQRLEELTAGEVDAVTDREGRTFLLRHAQENLRYSDAAKQAAILNALPAHIALLDTQGRIVSVNEAWRLFAEANGQQSPQSGVGPDYLAICDQAGGADGPESRPIAAAIRAVLAGTAKSYSIEYLFHSPTGQRWFMMAVTPLPGNPPNGAVVMHLDITERKLADEALRESESSLREAQEIGRVGSYVLDIPGDVWRRSAMLNTIFGIGAEFPRTMGGWAQIVHPTEREQMTSYLLDNIAAHQRFEREYRIVRANDGAERWVLGLGMMEYGADGAALRMVGTIQDITERKVAADRILRLNRVYAVLSGINTLIVRTQDRQELLDQACRITVEQGKFRLAWIGLLGASGLDVTPVVRAGVDEGYLDNIQLTARDDAPDRCEMVARVLREKTAVVCNDIATDPQMARWREEALRRGYRSVVVFPLQFADKVSAVLALYASEKDFFDTEEMKLLTELAGDIAFAMDHIEKQERLNYLAYYDVLTGLANRTLFLERVAQYMRSAASGAHQLALFLIDLERFKNINDSLGRAAGDDLLRHVAQWLTRNTAGDANLVARVGADLFAVVMPVVKQEGSLTRLLDHWIDAVQSHPFRLNDAVFRITFKVGVALFPDDGADADSLFKNAEAALKKAKTNGERYLFYTSTMTSSVAGNLTLENQLRQALDNGEFVLHYQPKVNLVSGVVTSAEALIRWNDPRTGLVPPGQFIPILEETGLIHEVGRWALRQAIADYLRWRAAGLAPVRIAVNVSALQLRHRGFIAELEQFIGIDAQAAAGLELEITESLIMENVKHSIASLQAIRALGISIAIDDFGTGFSSLSYLSQFPVNTLKIDRSFVIEMTDSPQGLALVSTIISLAHALQLKVVAEGVETEEQARLLRLLNCDEMQGYLFSKPVPGEIFESRFLALPPGG